MFSTQYVLVLHHHSQKLLIWALLKQRCADVQINLKKRFIGITPSSSEHLTLEIGVKLETVYQPRLWFCFHC